MTAEEPSTNIQAVMSSWHEWKLFVERSVAFSQDAIHVIVGVLLLLITASLLRKPLSSWWPWLVVLVSTFINEAIDLWVEKWPDPAMQYGEGFKDLLLTMLLPTVLLVTTRSWPRLYHPSCSTLYGNAHGDQGGP